MGNLKNIIQNWQDSDQEFENITGCAKSKKDLWNDDDWIHAYLDFGEKARSLPHCCQRALKDGKKDESALMYACRKGKLSIVKEFHQRYVKEFPPRNKINFNQKNNEGRNLLMI